MKKLALGILSLSILSAQSQNITDEFDIVWETYVGLTSFRTTIKVDDGIVYIPSNGDKRHGKSDMNDGIQILNASNGVAKLILNVEGEASEDCNGVAIYQDKLFFGNDYGQFYCYTKSGELVWKSGFGGWYELSVEENNANQEDDVEGAPVLADINEDGYPDAVFNVEGNGIVALNGKTGDFLWSFRHPWGDGTYMNAPCADDLDGDGVTDFVIGGKALTVDGYGYGNAIYAINGKSGMPLWQYDVHSGVHASPQIYGTGDNKRIVIAEAYSDVTLLYPDGKLDKFINLNMISGPYEGAISGLFSTPILTKSKKLVIGTSWWGNEDGVWICDLNSSNFVEAKDGLIELKDDAKDYHKAGPISSSAVVADVLKKPKGREMIICTEKGEMLIFDAKGNLHKRLKLPAGVEATPYVGDIDGDKKTEIIVACLDGKVYCYQTKMKAKKRIQNGQFRVNNSNTGVLEYAGF